MSKALAKSSRILIVNKISIHVLKKNVSDEFNFCLKPKNPFLKIRPQSGKSFEDENR